MLSVACQDSKSPRKPTPEARPNSRKRASDLHRGGGRRHQKLGKNGPGKWSTRSSFQRCGKLSRAARNDIEFPLDRGFGCGPIRLPIFIETLDPSIDSVEVRYLQQKGAFEVPRGQDLEEFLRCYVQYAHPFCPVLDLSNFLGTISRPDCMPKLSLLLVQAVMFAAAAYVDTTTVLRLGFLSRKDARKVLFRRVVSLYEAARESDPVVLIQVALLLTHWHDIPDDPKDARYWLGIAITSAKRVGMNCLVFPGSENSRKLRLWKRIWWTCYTRDRILSLGMRRPTLINDCEFEVPSLVVADFESSPLEWRMAQIVSNVEDVTSSPTRILFARLFMELAELCRCITNVLDTRYTRQHGFNSTQETKLLQLRPRTLVPEREISISQEMLNKWWINLTCDLRYFDECREHSPSADCRYKESLTLHRGVLSSLFYTVSNALHRPQSIFSSSSSAPAAERDDLALSKVWMAANQITAIYRDLSRRDLLRFLPNLGVTCVVPAALVHLIDTNNTDETLRNFSSERLHFCLDVLLTLRETYISADLAISYLRAAFVVMKRGNSGEARSHRIDHEDYQSSYSPVVLGGEAPAAGDFPQQPNTRHLMRSLLSSLTLAPNEQELLKDLAMGDPEIPVNEAEPDDRPSVMPQLSIAHSDKDDTLEEHPTLRNIHGVHDTTNESTSLSRECNNSGSALITSDDSDDFQSLSLSTDTIKPPEWTLIDNGQETQKERIFDAHQDVFEAEPGDKLPLLHYTAWEDFDFATFLNFEMD